MKMTDGMEGRVSMRAFMKFALVVVMAMACSNAGLAETQSTKKSAKAATTLPQPAPITVDMLMKFSPRARKEIVEAIVAQWPSATADGISSPNRIHHFLAELATESGGFRVMEENLNYSARRLRQIFPRYFKTDAEAQAFAGKPSDIANHVYGNRLGNVKANDGWDFRGSGLVQLTGRANYHARDLSLKLNPKLEEHPTLARSFPTAFHVAVSYWTSRSINPVADRDDLTEVRRRVNGGKIGLNEARIWLAQARRFVRLPGEKSADDKNFDDPASPGRLAMEDQLVTLGFLPPQDKSEKSTKSAQDKTATISDSLKKFQESRDIPQTGQFDEATLYELTDPGNYLELSAFCAEARLRGPRRTVPQSCR
jgi:putative chitinase